MAASAELQSPTRPDNRTRIVRLSRLMSKLCLAVAVFSTGGLLVYWLVTPTEAVFQHAGLPGFPVWEIGLGVRVAAILISAVPLGCLIWGLLQASRCFDAFSAGDFFTVEPARRLRGFAIAILLSTLLKPVAGAALSVLLSGSGHAGRRTLVLTVGSDTLMALVFAGLIAVIAWVMAQASTLADENAQFI